jgi:hypothetical protein
MGHRLTDVEGRDVVMLLILLTLNVARTLNGGGKNGFAERWPMDVEGAWLRSCCN